MMRKLFNFLYYILLMQFIIGLCNIFPNLKFFNKIRGLLLSGFFKKCGKNFQIAKGCIINMPRNMEIGNNVYIAHNVWINATGGLVIGDDVIISPKVVIATTKHSYENGKSSLEKSENKPIYIKNGVWVASNSVVTLGITIGEGSIVGACSSVTKDVEAYTFVGGVPAKKIKTLEIYLNE
ncbi:MULTISPECIES: acyltransferase [unclassified Acinetobacter]|uniref:acyltransferase n=1 Tax=unclassified Acinetobacter TaxID=196816 RepID=UPI0015D10CC7|nr:MULTISPECIES: acyltransferase [unclassified Acinetobacter]